MDDSLGFAPGQPLFDICRLIRKPGLDHLTLPDGKANPIRANNEATLKAFIETIERHSPALYIASGVPTNASARK